MTKKKTDWSISKLIGSWLAFWEGVVIYHYWGLNGSLWWTAGWLAFGLAVRLGRSIGLAGR